MGGSFIRDIPAYEKEFIDHWPKTRQSVRRGDRSPLGNHQQGVPRRRRKPKVRNTSPNMPGSDEGEHVGESGDMDLPEEELTPRWNMFLVQAAHFAKSLESELKKNERCFR